MFSLINKILEREEAINEREKQYEKNNAKSLAEQRAEQIREILELKGRKEDILKYIKERHWVDSEPAEVDGYKGKNIHINIPNIPAMKNFEGLNLDFFVSDDWVIEKTLHEKPELVEQSYSMEDISRLLGAMNRFMIELGLENDGYMNYKEELDIENARDLILKQNGQDVEKFYTWRCKAGDFFKQITGLKWWYGLKDAVWFCDPGSCHFVGHRNGDWSGVSSVKLLLKR